MSSIFSIKPGLVVAVNDRVPAPLQLRFADWEGVVTRKSVITSSNISRSINAQFHQTLRDSIYAYSFGERMGELQLSGIGFSGDCDNPERHGIIGVMEYFNQHNMRSRGQSITVMIATFSAPAVLTGLEVAISGENSGLASFVMRMMMIPPT